MKTVAIVHAVFLEDTDGTLLMRLELDQPGQPTVHLDRKEHAHMFKRDGFFTAFWQHTGAELQKFFHAQYAPAPLDPTTKPNLTVLDGGDARD